MFGCLSTAGYLKKVLIGRGRKRSSEQTLCRTFKPTVCPANDPSPKIYNHSFVFGFMQAYWWYTLNNTVFNSIWASGLLGCGWRRLRVAARPGLSGNCFLGRVKSCQESAFTGKHLMNNYCQHMRNRELKRCSKRGASIYKPFSAHALSIYINVVVSTKRKEVQCLNIHIDTLALR